MSKLELSRAMDRPRGPLAGVRVDRAPLIGHWINYDPGSGGVRELSLVEKDRVLVVEVHGVCAPSPCDWGEAAAEAFAAGVGGGAAVGFRARYDFGFSEVTLAAYLNLRLLVVDSYTAFRDGSGRAPYFLRDHFYQP